MSILNTTLTTVLTNRWLEVYDINNVSSDNRQRIDEMVNTLWDAGLYQSDKMIRGCRTRSPGQGGNFKISTPTRLVDSMHALLMSLRAKG